MSIDMSYITQKSLNGSEWSDIISGWHNLVIGEQKTV